MKRGASAESPFGRSPFMADEKSLSELYDTNDFLGTFLKLADSMFEEDEEGSFWQPEASPSRR